MSQNNQIVINIPSQKEQNLNPNLYALKRIGHFSYIVTDEIGLGLTSKVYKGKNDKTSNSNPYYR